MGEYLDGILVEDRGNAEDALQLLEQGEKGRAVLFTNLQPESGIDLNRIEDPDCLGLASKLMQVPEQLNRLVGALLGRTLIVRGRGAARRLVSQIPADARIVTLRGEVFYASGVVVAGQDGKSGLIGRPRQKKELQDRLA